VTEPLRNRFELVPHCSLTVRGAFAFFGMVFVPTFLIAGVSALQGFWPVLPFAGLEMAVLAWALKATFDRRRETETITVSDDAVRIESVHRRRRREIVFSRHWTQVKLRRPVSRLHPSRLTIESKGRELEVGRFLTEEERHGLAIRLQRLVGRMNESPSLA
jgi:uncharacterized membrane protein